MSFVVVTIGNSTFHTHACRFLRFDEDVNLVNISPLEFSVDSILSCSPGLLLIDFDALQYRTFKLLTQLAKAGKSRKSIVVGRQPSVNNAVKCMRYEAYDYVVFPEEKQRFLESAASIYAEWKQSQQGAELQQRQQKLFSPLNIIGESDAMQEVLEVVKKIIQRRWVTVLIQGETGTGKEVIARAIHFGTTRNVNAPFIEVNCTAIPENLLEAELFGYEKGAFTDARQTKKGLFELAEGGTLFLDEIGDMNLLLQAKLLKAIEEKQFRRLGGTKNIRVTTRLIAGTNADLERRIQEGLFRGDLYYRLNVINVHLPPLRHRDHDVLLLADYFLQKFADEYDAPVRQLSPMAQQMLMEYDWPGNVRELQHAIERVVLLGDSPEVKQQELRKALGLGKSTIVPALEQAEPERNAEPDREAERDPSKRIIEIPNGGISLKEGEKKLIYETLKMTNGNKSHAAEILNISRPRLKRKIDEYQINLEHSSTDPDAIAASGD